MGQGRVDVGWEHETVVLPESGLPHHPSYRLRGDHDGLPGAGHEEHGRPAEADHALYAPGVRLLSSKVPRGALRLLGDLELHHLLLELPDLPPRPAAASSRGRPHDIPRRYHPKRTGRERRASPENRRGLDEQRQGKKEKEERREQKEVVASQHSHSRRRRTGREHTGVRSSQNPPSAELGIDQQLYFCS